jgi:predicted anti-sigma-YlaC factor YlaD
MFEITCQEVRRELSNYMEEDVGPALRARIEAHVRACGGCRAVYDGVRNILRLVGGGEVLELPQGFSQRLLHRIMSASSSN